MKTVLFILSGSLFFFSFMTANAAPLAGEGEAGAVIISGNNNSQSYLAKAKLVYTWEKNIYTSFGRYLKADSNGVESARNWELGLRYERTLNEDLSAFIGHKAESDVFNGYIQRDSSDLGFKYFLVKSEDKNWFVEAGYRYQKTLPTQGAISHDSLGRLYTEFNKILDSTLSFKYWAEYLPNFTDKEAYLLNTEPSLNIMLNTRFSLKMAYLVQYQNRPPADGKHTTTTSTLNLVGKF